jgi:hypothetical protein
VELFSNGTVHQNGTLHQNGTRASALTVRGQCGAADCAAGCAACGVAELSLSGTRVAILGHNGIRVNGNRRIREP